MRPWIIGDRQESRQSPPMGGEARARMQRIQEISEELERLPEAVEVDIWQELLGNRELPPKSPNPQ